MDLPDDIDGSEAFPYPVSISRTDFKNFSETDVDNYLYKNHRFTSIDVLITELTALSKDLNQTLLDLVNSDFNDFIRLGKSINGGLDLIESISGDLKDFKMDLKDCYTKLDHSDTTIKTYLAKREQITHVKTLAKINVLLNDQITSFESILSSENESEDQKIAKLKNLTGLYLSISKLFEYVRSPRASLPILGVELTNDFITKYLTNKVSSLKLEFKGYLDQTTKAVIPQLSESHHEIILLLLNVYKLIGHESDVLAILKSKKQN